MQTPDAQEKRKTSLKSIQHQQGSKNSQYGTMWITNGESNRKIKVDGQIPEGFRKGRSVGEWRNLVDATGLSPVGEIHEGSSPSSPTKQC